MKFFYVTVLVLVAGAVPSHGRTESEDTVFNKTQPHERMNNVTVSSSKLVAYGDLFLVMQWPRTFCNYLNIVNRECYQPVPYRFTVHGLWPQLSGRGIDCRDQRRYGAYRHFRRRLLTAELVSDLNYFWLDLTSVDNNYFWESEYNKHGSCTFDDQNVYFGLTLELAKYLGDQLSGLSEIERGRHIITPGNSYLPSVIKNAVREVTSKMPMLHCIRVENRMQLLEIRFCAVRYGNRLYPQDCIFYSNCGSGQVYFP